MTSVHLFYIPLCIVVGFVGGFVFGRNTLLKELDRKREQLKRKKARIKAEAAAAGEAPAEG